MSIHDKTGQTSQSITEGWRALDLFTDRREAVRLYCSYLNEDPARERILFLYGDGGNGKSLLLRFLREYCCKRLRPENWEWVKSKPDEEFMGEIKEALGTDPVPYAVLDFGMKPVGDDRPQETFSGLLMLRRGLSGHNLNFSLFDFACIWYLHKTDKLTQERLKNLFPPDAFDFVSSIAGAITSNTWLAIGKTVLSIFNKRSSQWITLYRAKRRLDEERVAEIQRLEPETELTDLLPVLFAEDLNVSMSLAGAPKRLCLFFDTYEAFWGSQRNLSDDLFFQRDEWVRRLLGSVELSSGIVTVLAGRDQPRWAEAHKWGIPSEYVETFLVGHFKTPDAQQYLQRAGIEDVAMHQALIEYAQTEPDQIHPLYLGLCADVVLAAREKGVSLTPEDFAPQATNKGAHLVDRLMRYVDQEIGFAVRALSACRAFDRDLYLKLGEFLKFQATAPAFEVLSRFSFVWRSEEGGEGWYRIHSLLRRLMYERHDSVTRSAHQALEKHYDELSKTQDLSNVINLLYHMNRLDWERGVDNWLSVFESALRVSHYDLCRPLLELRGELIIESDFYVGRVSALEGDYFALLSMFKEARQEYLDAVAAYDRELEKNHDVHSLVNKGSAWQSLGVLQAEYAKPHDAVASYKEAVTVLDQALSLDANNLAAHVNRGNALLALGQLQAKAAQHLTATETFNTAVKEYDFVLDRTPNNDTALGNKGVALQTIGELQSRLAQHEAAKGSYSKAIAALEEAARVSTYPISAYLNMGNALMRLGELHVELSELDKAVKCFERSLTAFDEVFKRAPNHIDAYNNKGTSLHNLAELQMKLSQHEKAFASYEASIKSFDALLKRAPGHMRALINRGNALVGLGDLQNELSRYQEAKQNYEAAIATYDEILSRAADTDAYNNKASALRGLGELQSQLGQVQAALASYNQALASINEVLQYAPDSLSAYNNKGGILLRLGEAQSALKQDTLAISTYNQALAAFKEVLRKAPDYVDAHQNMGNTLVNIGELEAQMKQFESAIVNYQKAIASYDQVLKYSPDNALAYNNKGSTLRSLGNAYSRLSQDSYAERSYVAAVAACDEALKRSPDFVIVYFNKAGVLRSHATLMFNRSRHAEVIDLCKKAIAACETALKYSPNDARLHSQRGNVHGLMSMSQIQLSQQHDALESIVQAVTSLHRALEIVPDDEGDLFLLNELLKTLRNAGFDI